jgi:hypothetical protein
MKAEQPRDLGYMQLAVIEVAKRQLAPQSEIAFSTFVRNSLVSLLLSASAVSQDFKRRH